MIDAIANFVLSLVFVAVMALVMAVSVILVALAAVWTEMRRRAQVRARPDTDASPRAH